MNPVIFLDIDGVLNSADWLRRGWMADMDDIGATRHFNPEAGARLNRVIKATSCELVISSTWRITHSCKWIQRTLRRRGVPRARVIGKTPGGGGFRGPQIQDWLDSHEPRRFAILDDSDDMTDALYHRLIRTTWERGLQDEHVGPLIAMLEKPTSVRPP